MLVKPRMANESRGRKDTATFDTTEIADDTERTVPTGVLDYYIRHDFRHAEDLR